MKRLTSRCIPLLIMLLVFVSVPFLDAHTAAASSSTGKNYVYDDAGLLTAKEKNRLNRLAAEYSAKRQTDFIIYTTNNPNNKDVQILNEDLYDDKGFGYKQKFGDAVVLVMDMRNRDIYLAGYGEAQYTLDSQKLDAIREQITGDLSAGDYASAFEQYIKLSARYIVDDSAGSNTGYSDYSSGGTSNNYNNYDNYTTDRDSDNLLFKFWFQLLIAVVIGIVVVWIMLAGAGGRVTVNRSTYEEAETSSLLDQQDRYLHTTVTKTKIERNNSSGGGTSSGGNSHSGSRGSF